MVARFFAVSDIGGTISPFLRQILLTGSHSGALSGYQTLHTITYENEMQAAFGDIRFVTDSGAHVPYWIVSKTDNVTAEVWIKSAINDGSTRIWMYYGNAELSSISSMSSVIDSTNFSATSTATASSEYSASYSMGKSIDGIANDETDTSWLANPATGSWLNIAFNETRKLLQIKIHSAVGSDWKRFKDVTFDYGGVDSESRELVNSFNLQTHNITLITCTYLKLSPTSFWSGTAAWGGLTEVYTYGFKYDATEPTWTYSEPQHARAGQIIL